MEQELKPLAPIGEGEKKPYKKLVPDEQAKNDALPLPEQQPTPSEQYGKGYYSGSSLKEHIATKQGKWDEFANAIVQTASEATLGTLESASYMLDFENNWKAWRDGNDQFGNSFAEAMKEAKKGLQDKFPVYLTEENETFQPASFEWWMNKSPQVVGSALSLLIPAAGIAKIGKAVGLGATGQSLVATYFSRIAENTMEASQTQEEALAKGATKEEAAKQAANVFNTNWVFAATDFAEFSTIFKGLSSGAKGAKGITIAEKAAALAKEQVVKDAEHAGIKGAIKGLTTTVPAEAAEEAGQYITQQEGVNAATKGTDYFGAGFEGRLLDYIDDDAFKESALLGAMGGAVFSGAGAAGSINRKPVTENQYKQHFTKELEHKGLMNYFGDKLSKITQRGIQKEQAAYSGDTGTVERIANEDFALQAIGHLNSGTINKFKEALEVQSKAPDNSDLGRRLAKDYLEDTDFVIDQQAKLKSNGTAEELHIPILATQLELRQSGRLTKSLEEELAKIEAGVIKNKELDPSLQELKRSQLAAHAYAELAKTNPKFLPKAIELDSKLLSQLNSPAALALNIDFGKALHTTQDEDLAKKTFQLISTTEKAKELKGDLYNLSTPQGQAAIALAKSNKQEERQAQALIDNKATTKEQLQEATKSATQPVIAAKLSDAIEKKVEEEKEINKKQVEDELLDEAPVEAAPEDYIPLENNDNYEPVEDNNFQDEEQNPIFEAPEENVEPPVEYNSVAEVLEAIEREQPTEPVPQEHVEQKIEQVQQKAVKTINTVVTRTKQIKGHWEGDKFVQDKDAYGVPVPQEYFDNQLKKSVPFHEVFDSDANGVPVINTPLVKDGDQVILKVVDNGKDKRTRYSLTPGFVPTGEQNHVIQVFRIDKAGRAYPKPLTELPSADSAQGNNPEVLAKLRQAVLSAPNQVLATTIASHSIGDVRVSSTDHSLTVFTHDYIQQQDGSWEFKKLSHKPIIAMVKLNNDISTPNLNQMSGITEEMRLAVTETELRDRGATDLYPGSRYVYRTNPQGNQQLVQLQGRTLNDAEIAWLKKNITEYFKSGDLEALADVLYVKRSSKGIFSTQKGQKKRDIVKQGGRQLIVLQNTKGNPTVLVPLTKAEKNNQWIHLTLPEFDSLLNDKPFTYQKVDPVTGEMTNLLYSSTKDPVEKIANIQAAVKRLLGESFRNMREESLNSEHEYIDQVTGEKYPTYYDFLVETQTATAKVPGSAGIGFGEDNSYSFYNAGLHLNTNVNPVVVTQEQMGGQVVLEDKTPIPPPVETKKSTKSRRERILGEKTRLVHQQGFEIIRPKEYEWFTSIFGESSLEVIRDIDRVLSKGGLEAFGIYHNALVKLAELGETGTLYHEAFHFVFDPQLGLITEGRRNKVIEEGKKIYGRGEDIEEKLAEDFRLYQLSGGKKVPSLQTSQGLFRRLYNAIKKLLGFRSPIENLFREINSLNPTLKQRLFFAEARRRGLNDSSTEEKTRLLPGFLAYRQQVEGVEVSAYQIMNYLWEAVKGSDLTIEELLTSKPQKGEKSVLDDAFDILRAKYREDYERIHSTPRDDRNDDDYFRHDSYLSMGVVDKINNPDEEDNEALGKWEDVVGDLNVETGFKTEVLKQFATYGFRVILSDGTIQEPTGDEQSEPALSTGETQADVVELADTEKNEDIHGIDVTMKDPIRSLSQTIKLFLATIPDTEHPTHFGLPTPINFNKVFGNLSAKLADTKVPLLKLQEIAKEDSLLNAVFTKLSQELQAGNTKLIAEFNTRLNLSATNFVTFLDEFRNGEHTARMIDTNRNSADRALLNQWREKFTGVLVRRTGEVNKSTVDSYLDRIKKFKEKYRESQDRREALGYNILKEEVNKILNDLKITLPKEVWTVLERENPKLQRKTVERWLFGVQRNSLENFFTNLSNDGDLNTTSVFDELASRAKLFTDVSDGGVFLDENNNQRYPINLPSAASDFINKVKQNGKEVAAYYEQDKFYKNNAFIELIKNVDDVANLRKLDVSAYKKNEGDAKEFQERTPAESIIMRMIAFFNNGSKEGAFFLGTHEAKQKHTLLTLKKYSSNTDALAFTKRVVTNTVKGEIVRIQRIKEAERATRTNDPLITDIAIIKDKGKQFVYVPKLNQVQNLTKSVTEGEVSVAELERAWAEANTIIDEFIEEQYQGFKNELVKQGVITLSKEGSPINDQIPDGIFENRNADTFLRNFFYNDIAWRFELSKVFNGDLAFYKSDDDYFKRGYQTVTPGTKPYNDLEKPVVLRVAVHAVQSTPGVKNGRDSQTVMTVEAWKKITEPLGQWTKEHEYLYQFAWKHGQTVNQAIVENNTSQEQSALWRKLLREVATAPIKPFQFSEKVITLPNGDKMIVKEQVKDSRAVMNPEFVLRHPGYKQLYQWMQDNQIDVVVDEDAVKVGKYGVSDISKPIEPWQVRIHSLDDLRLPQLNNNQVKEEVSGSQYHKLILGNIDKEGDYNGKTGQHVIEEYGEAWAEVQEAHAKHLKNRLGFKDEYVLSEDKTERLNQLKRIKEVLSQELMSRGLNENYSDSLKIILDQLGQPKFVASLAFPLNSTKFVGTLTNLFKKEFLNPKSPGFVGVDFADYVIGQKTDANLKFVTNENGVVTEAEIGMPVTFFNKIGLNYRDYMEFGEDGQKTGKLDWNKLSKEQQSALQGIVYRIPTSNKSSMTPVRIVQVISPTMGQIVMVPPEFLTQQGLDFDYDKSQVLLRPLNKEGKIDNNDPHTRIFDLGWSVLTAPQHYNELTTPLTSDKIKVISDEYKAKEQGKWLSPMNPARDVIAEEQNRDSKIMVGTFSRFNTAHAVLQTISPYVQVDPSAAIDISVKGKYKFDELGRKLDSKGNLISESFGEYQSAALDAGKDPLLYYLSVNKSTAAMVGTMLLYGMDPKLITSFFKQPVVAEWMDNMRKIGRADTAIEATLESAAGLRTKYTNFLTGKMNMRLTEEALEKSLTVNLRDNIDFQARVLAELSKLQTLSKVANNLSSVLSIDTFKDMTGPENLEAKLNQAFAVTDPESPIRVDPRVFQLDQAPKEAKRLASFYKYAIADGLVFLHQFFPYMGDAYVGVKHTFEDVVGSELFNPKSIKKLNQFIDFYLMESTNSISHVLDKVAPNPRERWLYSDPTRSIFVHLESQVEKFKTLSKNKLINSIRASYSKQGGIQMIGVNNSNSRINKTELTQAWRDLMLDDNKEIQILAYDLVRFAIYTSGFGYNTRSFADLIPIDFFIETGVTERHYSLINSDLRLDQAGAVRSFIRHQFKNIDEVQEEYVKWRVDLEGNNVLVPGRLTKIKFDQGQKHISEFSIPQEVLDKRKIGTFVKINTPVIVGNRRFNAYRLYEANPMNSTDFREVQPLGEEKNYFEVTADGLNPSRVPNNQNSGVPDPWIEARTEQKQEEEKPKEEGTTEVPDCSK